MSGSPTGSVLGASTSAGAVLANTGMPTLMSVLLGGGIFAALLALYIFSKVRNKSK